MLIKNERTMEDYISNDDAFNEYLQVMYDLKNVKLLGRQVHVGDGNILDLLYEGSGNSPDKEKTKYLIIVELKCRPLELVDLSQIGRYSYALQAYLWHGIDSKNIEDFEVGTVLVGTGVTTDFAHFANGGLYDDKTRFMTINTDVYYEDVTNKWWAVENLNGNVDMAVKEFKANLIKSGESGNEQ